MDKGDREEVFRERVKAAERFFLEKKTGALYKHILEIVEKPLIEMVLEKTDGNQKKAAAVLGINRNTLHTKIKKLGVDVNKFKFNY
ncbi:MAG: hypothetical protein GY853_11165 [PVC group bacterium]|nr:hypothetical protein [PVC group bacterium]